MPDRWQHAVRRKESKTPLSDDLADVAEDIAAASRVAAALASAAAFFAAPAGLLAVAAALGLAPRPLIVTVLPALVAFAVGAAALVSIVRALGREDWLNALAPQVSVMPMDLITRTRKAPQRVRRSAADKR